MFSRGLPRRVRSRPDPCRPAVVQWHLQASGMFSGLTIRRDRAHGAALTLHTGILSALERRTPGPAKAYRTHRRVAHSAQVKTHADVFLQRVAGAPRNAPTIVVVMCVVFGSGAPAGFARPNHRVLGKPFSVGLLAGEGCARV